jgi:hypothetical protein
VASQIRAITSAMLSALRGINGTGGYHFDVTDAPTERVLGGFYPEAPLVPFVSIRDLAIRSTDENGVPLGLHRRFLDVTVVGMCGANTGDGFELLIRSTELLADIDRALMGDRTLSGSCLDVRLRDTSALDGAELGLPGYGVAIAVYEVMWEAEKGV